MPPAHFPILSHKRLPLRFNLNLKWDWLNQGGDESANDRGVSGGRREGNKKVRPQIIERPSCYMQKTSFMEGQNSFPWLPSASEICCGKQEGREGKKRHLWTQMVDNVCSTHANIFLAWQGRLWYSMEKPPWCLAKRGSDWPLNPGHSSTSGRAPSGLERTGESGIRHTIAADMWFT